MMPPLQKPSPRLQLHHNTASPDDLIIRANALLSLGKSRQAIELYTEVLYDKAPGHVVAFLNRSMAYILESHPELAAADAYRAADAINMFNSSTGQKRRSREFEIKRYLRAESSRILYKHDWTRGNRRFIPCADAGFPKRPLASLVIDMDEDDCPVWHDPGIELEDICLRLEVRALYRLCGSLFQCRGGAAQDALGIISDVLTKHTMFAPEAQCFRNLGDEILSTVTRVIDLFRKDGQDTDDEHTISTSVDGSSVYRTKPESVLKSHVTLTPALQYWVDTHEPDFAQPNTHQELRDFAAASTDSCMPMAVDQSSIGQLPRIQMHASKDHLPGDSLLYERSPWHVTTSTPERVLNTWDINKAGCLRLYCDTCATALLMPAELVGNIIAQSPSQKRSTAMALDGLKRAHSDHEMDTEERKRRMDWSASTHITFCSSEHEAPYCGTTCRRKRRSFDTGIHESKIEIELRNDRLPTGISPRENVPPGHPHHLYNHSKTQTLYDLLFLRIYASALNEDKHPLELVKFLRGNLSPPSSHAFDQPGSKKPKEVLWSFQNNIVRPIWCVNRYHQALGQDPLRHLRQSDGWVINTLLTKIRHATEIAKGAMSAIIYNIDQESKTYCFRGLEEWVSGKAEAVYESEEAFNEVWVAILDPLVSMIRVANEAKGEKPNCWLKYEEGIRVIAGQPDDPHSKKDVAVRQGEVLLRAKPKFLGGSPYEVTPYSQRDPSPPVNVTKTDSPAEKDAGHDHEMIDVKSEAAESQQPDPSTVEDPEEGSSDTVSSSDEEMLEILDNDSPEEEVQVPGSNPPPTDTDYLATLDGQAEVLEKRLEAVVKSPSAEGEAPEWEDEDSSNWKQKMEKHSLFVTKKLASEHWSGHTRVRKTLAFRPPRNSLFKTARAADVQIIAPKQHQQQALLSATPDDDGFPDAPVGTFLFCGASGDEVDKAQEPAVVQAAPGTLEIVSISDVRKGTPSQDPEEGPSASGKGKGVLRGGDAWGHARGGDAVKKVHAWFADDDHGDWMDIE
ncbi:MAG: hypothetical protein Q9225_007325 [Loekoesia sp. 1 TL-2023]